MKKEEKILEDKVVQEHDVKEIVKIADKIKKADKALIDEDKEIVNE